MWKQLGGRLSLSHNHQPWERDSGAAVAAFFRNRRDARVEGT